MSENEAQETVETEQDEVGFLENDPLSEIYETETPTEETVNDQKVVTATEDGEKGNKDEETVVPADSVEKTKTKPEKDEDLGWKNAYFAEVRRRKALEEQSLQKQPEPEKQEFDWTDPNKTIESTTKQVLTTVEDRFVKMSLFQLGRREQDAKEKIDLFDSLAKQNPTLYDQFYAHPDPGQFAYDYAKEQQFRNEVGSDPKAYEEKIRADERARVEAEFKKKAGENQEIINNLPPSAASLTDRVPTNAAQKDTFEDLFPGQIAS